jgi:Leucine-rich repeat (LRR) protein
MLDEKIVDITHKPWYPSLTFMLNVLDPQDKVISKIEKEAILHKSYNKEEYQKISQQIANKILSYRNSIDYLFKSGQLPFDSFNELKESSDLDLSNKNLATLLPFNGLSKLFALYLSDNKLNMIQEGAFQDLANLNLLYLEHNELETIPVDLFKNLSKLTVLALDNNLLTTIHPDTFVNLRNLQTLDLSNNQLIDIQSGTFSNLNNLTELRLSNNQLKTLNTDDFKKLTNLKALYLDGNQFSPEEQERIKHELASSIPNLYIKMLPTDPERQGRRH